MRARAAAAAEVMTRIVRARCWTMVGAPVRVMDWIEFMRRASMA